MKVFGITGGTTADTTGLMQRLVAEIAGREITVSTARQTPPGFEIDQPGRDSFRHRAAGATQVMVSSHQRWALMHELRGAPEPTLEELLARLAPVDLVLVNGFKTALHPRLEMLGDAVSLPADRVHDGAVRAVVSHAPPRAPQLPWFAVDDTVGIADCVLREVGL